MKEIAINAKGLTKKYGDFTLFSLRDDTDIETQINNAMIQMESEIGDAMSSLDVEDMQGIVLVKNTLLDVVNTIKISRKVVKNIHQNLAWAFIYNIIGIPVAAGCFISLFGLTLNPMICAAAMSLSSFCVVTNALSLKHKKT